jgi:hypothetical protein
MRLSSLADIKDLVEHSANGRGSSVEPQNVSNQWRGCVQVPRGAPSPSPHRQPEHEFLHHNHTAPLQYSGAAFANPAIRYPSLIWRIFLLFLNQMFATSQEEVSATAIENRALISS